MAKKVMKKEIKSISIERPIGVAILSILGYIGAAVTFLMGLALILGSAIIAPFLSSLPGFEMAVGVISTTVLIVFGIICLPFAILDYFIARGLWEGKNWARIVMLIFVGLGALQSLAGLPGTIVSLAINGLVIWYIGFYKPAVAYFK